MSLFDPNSVVLDGNAVDILASEESGHLAFLGIRRCGLTDADVRRIARAHPNLALDLQSYGVSDELMSDLTSEGRVISADDRAGFENWLRDGGVTGLAPNATVSRNKFALAANGWSLLSGFLAKDAAKDRRLVRGSLNRPRDVVPRQ